MEPGSLADRGVIEPAGVPLPIADALSALAGADADQVRAADPGTGGQRTGAGGLRRSADGGARLLAPRALA